MELHKITIFFLLLTSFVSCGCPKDKDTDTPVPTVTVTVPPPPTPVPTGTVPPVIEDPKPIIEWRSSSDPSTAEDVDEHYPCMMILFRSNNERENIVMDRILDDHDLVDKLNKYFYPIRWDDEREKEWLRKDFFSIPKGEAALLFVSPVKKNGPSILFTPFDPSGYQRETSDVLRKQMFSLFDREMFKNCEEILLKVDKRKSFQ